MKAAVVTAAGQGPVFLDFEEPEAREGEELIAVSAAAISSRASGVHYSSAGQFPFVAGIDGVGRTEDGRRVYFVFPRAPFGGMAERAPVPAALCVPVPHDLDDATAAAMANPGMSAWVALTERAQLKPGETVLVNGATGTAGRLAVQIARHLGATKVIATGRDERALEEMRRLGADVAIVLREGMAGDSFEPLFAERIDVVIDYLWGESARALLIAGAKAGSEAVPIRFVQVGAVSGGEIALPSAVLRSSAIVLMGSGIGSVPLDRLAAATGEMLRAAAGRFQIAFTTAPLSAVESAWQASDTRRRTVLAIG